MDGRRAGRPRVLLRPRPDAARARHDRHRRVAGARAARHDQPRLRRPCALRRREDARRRRGPSTQDARVDRPQRGLAAGLGDRADGVRTPAAQPDRARRRLGPRDGRQLLRGRAVDLNAGVYAAEQWNPATGQWRTLASMQITRQYHSTALLLPDGRCCPRAAGSAARATRSATWARTPRSSRRPTLPGRRHALAPRPPSTSAPASPATARRSQIGTGDAASIAKVALVRLGAVTHSDNMEQRYIPLSFTAGATSLTATSPINANVAPPGPTCSSSSTPTACLPLPTWSPSRLLARLRR